VVQCLPKKHEVLNSNYSTTKKKFLGANENGNTTYQNLWNIVKAVLSVMSTYNRKSE
jgi:hypothetical protein